MHGAGGDVRMEDLINRIFNEDCLEGMKKIPDGSIDMILCDLPFGTTASFWDKRIPFEPLWEQYKRITKKNAAIVLFSQMPFGSDLIQSNRKMFRYEWIWEKNAAAGFLLAHKMPLRAHENILIFYQSPPTYNPQKTKAERKHINHGRNKDNCNIYSIRGVKSENYIYKDDGYRFPRDVQKFQTPNTSSGKVFHPTQKPIDLLEYLIKTYTNEGELVLDNCIGSGSTAVAAINTNRNFIGFETDKKYFDIANKRIEKVFEDKEMRLFA